MIRQSSYRNLKPKSREKSKTPVPNSQTKAQNVPNKINKVQSGYHNHPYNQPKLNKNDSKSKISKNASSTNKNKVTPSQKHSPDIHALHMKANLKQLISRNAGPKPKNVEVVPDLIRNIEKQCKELKKIHEKQHKVHDKRASLQEHKVQREKRLVSGNKSQEVHLRKKKESHKPPKHKEFEQPQQNRRSIQINLQNPNQPEQDPLTNERLKKPYYNADNTKNFVELFKIYKKSFEIEDVKVGKSGKNTNYNTNQSKNSSSLYNSHGYSAIGQHLSKNKSKIEEKVNFEKIQSLIRSQQSSVSRQNSSAKKNAQEKADMVLSQCYKKRSENHYLNEIEELDTGKNESLEIQEEKQFKVELQMPVALMNHHAIPEKEVVIPQPKHQDKSGGVSRESSGKKSVELNREKQHLEKQFTRSRYYVQPIPRFQQKKQRVKSEEDDSLAGCEITLIQNNIICEDSQLQSLEL